MVWFDVLFHGSARTQFDTVGRLRFHRGTTNVKKPLCVVAITGSLALVTAMAIAYIVADLSGLPSISAWPAGLFVMAIYAVIAHKLRPEPNVDNLGWLGALNNPFRFSDNLNRFLFHLQIFFGPGRLIGMGMVDVCTYLGLLEERTEEVLADEAVEARDRRTAELIQKAEARFDGKPQGVQELASWRFMESGDQQLTS